MAKTFTAPFAQTTKTASAVVTAGTEGALLTRLAAVPRATVTASGLLLWISLDSGTTKHLLEGALMAAQTVSATTATAVTTFSRYTEYTPLRLQASASLYVATAVALTGGIVFTAEYTDF